MLSPQKKPLNKVTTTYTTHPSLIHNQHTDTYWVYVTATHVHTFLHSRTPKHTVSFIHNQTHTISLSDALSLLHTYLKSSQDAQMKSLQILTTRRVFCWSYFIPKQPVKFSVLCVTKCQLDGAVGIIFLNLWVKRIWWTTFLLCFL